MLKGLLLAMCLRQHSQSLQAEEQRRSQRMVIRVPAVVTVLSGDVLNDPASEAELVSEELGSSTPGTKPEALAATDLKQPVTITGLHPSQHVNRRLGGSAIFRCRASAVIQAGMVNFAWPNKSLADATCRGEPVSDG